jgi:hypothetical protein
MIPITYLMDDCAEEGWVTVVDGLSVKEEPKPEIPPEVWNQSPVDPEKCMAAVRAMSRSA